MTLLRLTTMRGHGVLNLPSGFRTAVTQHNFYRSFSMTSRFLSQIPDEPVTAQLPSRWLSDIKKRIGKCIMFGCSEEQIREAGKIAEELACNWRELVAGSEGFLTAEGRRGLFRRPVEWGEQDSMGHVNNVIYNRYAETARIEWVDKIATFIDPAHGRQWRDIITPKGTGLILRRMETDFKFPLQYPDRITVLHKLRSKPLPSMDSFILDVLILTELHQRPAARCVEDIVVYDYQQGKKAPLKPFMVETFQQIWQEQEEARWRGNSKVKDILDRVSKLEKGSWDRDGAIEQVGVA